MGIKITRQKASLSPDSTVTGSRPGAPLLSAEPLLPDTPWGTHLPASPRRWNCVWAGHSGRAWVGTGSRPQPQPRRATAVLTRVSLPPWEAGAPPPPGNVCHAPARQPRRPTHHAPHPAKPMAWMTVRTNWAPKTKKKAMKLKELSALERERAQPSRRPARRCQPQRHQARAPTGGDSAGHTASPENTAVPGQSPGCRGTRGVPG